MEINEFRMTFHDAEVTFSCSLNSQGTLREFPGSSKSQRIHDLRKGFRVFGKAHDCVMEKLPQSNENDAPKSGQKSKGSPQNMGFNGKVGPKVTIF